MSIAFVVAQVGLNSTMMWAGGIVVAIAVFVFMFIVLLAKQYKRCPSNRVLVIYGRTGKGKAATTVHGGAAFVIPLIQDYAFMSLEPIQIEIPLRGALSIENIRVNVPSVFTVAISTEPAVMQQASIRLLGLTDRANSQASRGNHLRHSATGHRRDGNRRDQSRPRQVPAADPDASGIGAEQDRAAVDQRQHHRHHRRVGLYRRDRAESGVRSGSESSRRRGRQRPHGRNACCRRRAGQGDSGGQRHPRPVDRHSRSQSRSGRARGGVGKGSDDRREGGLFPARIPGQGRRARNANSRRRRRRRRHRGRKHGARP